MVPKITLNLSSMLFSEDKTMALFNHNPPLCGQKRNGTVNRWKRTVQVYETTFNKNIKNIATVLDNNFTSSFVDLIVYVLVYILFL